MNEGAALQMEDLQQNIPQEEKLQRQKKRKARRILQGCFAATLCVIAALLVVTSLLLATGRLGWGEYGIEILPRTGEEAQPQTQTQVPAEGPPDEDVQDNSGQTPLTPLDLSGLAQTEHGTSVPSGDYTASDPGAAAQTGLSGMRKTVADDPSTFTPNPLYCTIWPIKDLKIYLAPENKIEIGTAPACSMYCVLEEDAAGQLFRIRTGADEYGWIDSRYCLINLTEYLGTLCSYNITNSISSAYTIHEYEIPGLTGKVITGYENIRLADGSFLVPFLYPCCTKLVNAARQAYDAGYRIKIYDSYRPRTATNSIYYTAIGIIDSPLPSSTVTGRAVDLPMPAAAPEGEYQRNYLIYRDLIEFNGWDMSAFLAPGASRHNMGVALDMTFEDAVTKEEISAQTLMHDLSAYSTIRSNNKAAALVYKIMQGCKMHNIVSEWWHFQDNEAMNSLKPPYCENGVSAEGWTADEHGERYRLADGTVLKSCMMLTDDGTVYFDADGYLMP